MKCLVIGSGGREHAISKKLAASPLVEAVYCAPGNAGMKKDGIRLVNLAETEHEGLIEFVRSEGIAWTFVGPEIPLLNGIVDDFQAEGLAIFGPTKAAALIEGSKSFAKELMARQGIPTAESQTFSRFAEARKYIEAKGAPIVIKADGLAAGKGVVVAETLEAAVEAASEMLEHNRFGASGQQIVVEEFLSGEEFSLLAFVRDTEVYPMVISQDHKRAYNGDRGPNTGGMGAYTPVPQIPQTMVDQAVEEVLKPAVRGMKELGRPFTGILYAGLIATAEGPKVIEFNARFGDPETQVVLPRLKSDLAEIIDRLLSGKAVELSWESEGFCLGVVVAAEGYPENYQKGALLPDFSTDPDVSIYYAGVEERAEELVGAGGRIYLVEASGQTIEEAQEKIYSVLKVKNTDHTFYRTDVGSKALVQK
ncbi:MULTISPECIES: phosphoribosylamine--glycine ligase [Enterococcus]|uniref:Phosphoribosylamine--glycine ligase n=1 Tax=Enterococcus mundtii TaxID=53346 RepID=A0ABQ0VA03_ENTMU|nr:MULTISPECIES: phosphoribosylamine--glycine ligase [Enterococcus]GEN18846.1 phosphoribosylamine--glycine ligase [Ligilactobacillus acidipiscis]AUB52443.1 phosphoribosylamine--glycine ligase [Enterococcus mundtii]MZZ58003.1 phosphoribosylamine--glycine ligase [Enterococcus mundtii]MZZ60978.1 phosphoribosylamine--glycine ligase [Enterococcus mundtii]MZZ67963.1 phosphoribosylamine--glycine ligase [Enterococcus mundtii]